MVLLKMLEANSLYIDDIEPQPYADQTYVCNL